MTCNPQEENNEFDRNFDVSTCDNIMISMPVVKNFVNNEEFQKLICTHCV